MSLRPGVVVWEWMNEVSKWTPYEPKISNFMELKYIVHTRALGPGNNFHAGTGAANSLKLPNLGEVERKMKMYDIDFNAMVQIRKETGTQRLVRRKEYDRNHPYGKNILWVWSGDRHGEWCKYDSETSEILEKALSINQSTVDLQNVCNMPYVIDLTSMTQVKKSTGYVRKIQRITITDSYTVAQGSSALHSQTSVNQPLLLPNQNVAAASIMPSTPPMPSQSQSGSHSNQNTLTKPHHPYPPVGSGTVLNSAVKDISVDEILSAFTQSVTKFPQNEECCICCEELTEPSGYDTTDKAVLQLSQCKHMYHHACLVTLLSSGNKRQSIQCPTCKAIHGVKHGDCPPGKMEYHTLSQSLSGYPECGTISITYHIASGMQGPEHPNPGQKFSTVGFPRTGYIPDNNQGRGVFKLLKTAWERRLTFTIGTSVTSNISDTVVWNEIHHKTELSTNLGHGYPDPNYLNNVTAELAVHGVTDE